MYQTITANESPRRFALVAMTAAAPECRVSRTELRRRLFSDVGADSVRQTIRRAQAAGWVRVDGDDVVLHHHQVSSAEPVRFVHDLLVSTPGELLPTDGWADELPSAFTEWWCSWRRGQQELLVTALVAVVEAKWLADVRDEAWAGMRHLERWAPDDPTVRALQARMVPGVNAFPATGRFMWPQIPRPEVEDPLLHHLTVEMKPGVTAAFIQGEAGAGKSTLLESLVHRASAARPGLRIVRVAGDWVPSEAADGAWMRTATRQRLIEALLAIPGVDESIDGQWLREALMGLHAPVVLRDRLAWLEALRGAWRAALEQSPTGIWLVLDDVQWIDQETQQLLTALLTMRTDYTWQLVAASRAERPTLWTELARRTPDRWVETSLSGLSPNAIAIVALQTQAPPAIVSDAYHYAEGHPFRWRELVRRAIASGRVPNDETLTELLAKELASWNRSELSLAFTVLLLDEFATWELLARALDIPPSEVENAARLLRHRGILEPPGDRSTVRVWIAADRWRDAILQTTDPDTRRDLHRRVGTVLDGSMLLRERLDVQLRVVEHERQGGALEAAVARMPDVAARAAKSGQTIDAFSLWTTVLRDVHAAIGDIPAQQRRQWAEYAMAHQIHAEELPASLRGTMTPEEQILQACHSSLAGGDEAHERSLDRLMELAAHGEVAPTVRMYAMSHGVVYNETLPARRAYARRQRLLAQLTNDAQRDEVPRNLVLWYTYHMRDWVKLEQLIPHDPTAVASEDVIATLTTLRLLGRHRHAWAVGAAAMAAPSTSAYVRWLASASMISLADVLGDHQALQAIAPIAKVMREQILDLSFPESIHRLWTQSVLLVAANDVMSWDDLADQEMASTWQELASGRAFANSSRLAAQGLAMYVLARNGRKDEARAWMSRFQQMVTWSDVLMIAETGAPNVAWRILYTLALIDEDDQMDRLRLSIRSYPEMRAWVMREPTIIPRTLTAYYGCQMHELWGAESLRPVRSIQEATAIAHAGSVRLPPLPPLPQISR